MCRKRGNMKRKNFKQLMMVLTLIVSMVAGSVAMSLPAVSAKATDKVVVYVAVEGKTTSGTAITVDKTAVVLEKGSKAIKAIQTVLDQSAYKGNYVMTETSWGISLDSIGGLATEQVNNTYCWWVFSVNGIMAMASIDTYELKDQDKISLVYGDGNGDVEATSFKEDGTANPSIEKSKQLYSEAVAKKNVLATNIYNKTFENGKKIAKLGARTDDFYTVYSLAKSGFEAKEFYKSTYDTLVKDLKDFEDGKALEDGTTKAIVMASGYASPYYAKIALAVTAMGYDATNVGGINLIEKMAQKNMYEVSSPAAMYGVYARDGILLMAFDEGKYTLPTGDDYITRAVLVNALLDDVSNMIDSAICYNMVDSAAMAVQALTPYVNSTDAAIDKEEVTYAVKQVLGYLATVQNKDGYGLSYDGSINGWSLAQAMYTMGLAGVNVLSEDNYDVIKNGATVFDQAASLVNEKEGTVDEGLMSFQPEQLLRGYTSTLNVLTASFGAITGNTETTGETTNNTTVKLTKVKNVKVAKSGKITFSKVKNAKKYEIQISTDKNFKKAVVKKNVKKNTLTYKSFKKGKKYFVRVRAINGKVKGAFSNKVTFKK